MIPTQRRLSMLLLSTCILASPLSGSPLDKADRFFDKTCDKEDAEEPFLRGMSHYDKECKLAIPLLEEAAGLCPEPEGPMWFRSRGLLKRPYLPFYFLGDCHYILKDLPNALRHFYLSSCVGEPKRDKDNTKSLAKQTAECRSGLASKRRPQQHPPEFSEGLRAFGHDWGKAADNMWNARQIESDDGQMRLTGHFADPYFPGLRLAKALAELGCIREACRQYDQFQFKDLIVKSGPKDKYKDEREFLEMLSSECAGKNRERSADNETCQRWRCWVGEGSPK